MKHQTIKIAIIAAEDSGDLLAADLMHNLSTKHENIEFIGVGGAKMLAAGLNLIADNKEFAIMGIAEVVKKLPRLLKLRKYIVNQILKAQCDLFIGVDAPDLNFPIEKKLKKHKIKIIHYVSPSIWAWRPKRAIKISQITDLVLTLFPFEPPYYQKSGGNAVFVGHPLADRIELKIDKDKAKSDLNLKQNSPVLALLPGSRNNELKAHTTLFLQAAEKLKQQNPDLQIVSANTNEEKINFIRSKAAALGIEVLFFNDATKVLKAANMALLASGTVTLEAMLCKTAMVVAYKISPITYGIVKTFNMMLLPYYSLPNVMYEGFLVPEVMQKDLTVDRLYQELTQLLHPNKLCKLQQEFLTMHKQLQSNNHNACHYVWEFIKNNKIIPIQKHEQTKEQNDD